MGKKNPLFLDQALDESILCVKAESTIAPKRTVTPFFTLFNSSAIAETLSYREMNIDVAEIRFGSCHGIASEARRMIPIRLGNDYETPVSETERCVGAIASAISKMIDSVIT